MNVILFIIILIIVVFFIYKYKQIIDEIKVENIKKILNIGLYLILFIFLLLFIFLDIKLEQIEFKKVENIKTIKYIKELEIF